MDQNLLQAVTLIVERLKECHVQKKDVDLNKLKTQICRQYGLKVQPRLTDILACVPSEWRKRLLPKLRAKPSRTASGIAAVAVMCVPHRCPHLSYTGNICVYCPGGPDSIFAYSTQSYTGYEPTSMRAMRNRYDPYMQVRDRIRQLATLGHSVDKIELILMGGTFMCLDKGYRDNFIMNLHDALSGHCSSNLDESIVFSEHSKSSRCVGLTIETRPDYCQAKHLNDMLKYGCTRLEIGVQSIYEDVALDTNRGHTVAAAVDTFRLAKEAGFKITTHMMPDLPNVGYERDYFQFIEFFNSPKFRADGLKIYPTLVIEGTGLYELYSNGLYKSYSASSLIDLLAQILTLVPPWVRIYRIQRDIPMPLVSSSGVTHGHLRELVLQRMADLGLKCRDVRTREVGIQEIHHKITPKNVELIRRDYVANEGWETFLSYEDPEQDILVGLLRLRRCSVDNSEICFRSELNSVRTSIIRELHVYGTALEVFDRNKKKFQHQGFGKSLVEEAEHIARTEHNSVKMAIISGVGTRNYYRKMGYELEGVYMVKIVMIPHKQQHF